MSGRNILPSRACGEAKGKVPHSFCRKRQPTSKPLNQPFLLLFSHSYSNARFPYRLIYIYEYHGKVYTFSSFYQRLVCLLVSPAIDWLHCHQIVKCIDLHYVLACEDLQQCGYVCVCVCAFFLNGLTTILYNFYSRLSFLTHYHQITPTQSHHLFLHYSCFP